MTNIEGQVRRAVEDYNMIEDGDKIAIALSGGKDSVCLLAMLASLKRYSPEKFDLVAITVDLSFTGQNTDYGPLQQLCDSLDVPLHIVDTQIGEIVFDVRKEENPCAISVYIARSGEDVFSLAKRLNQCPDKIKETNKDLQFPLNGDERIVVYRQK